MCPLRAAGEAGVPVRTAERWLARYRQGGLANLARASRHDAGTRQLPLDLLALVEGMALRRPRSSAAAIHRRVGAAAKAQGWRIPSYGTVHAVIAALDPGMVTLAQDGPAAFRDRFDEGGKPVRPWLTTVVDDHSRAIAGYSVFLGAPLRAEYLPYPAPCDLAQGRSGVARLRHPGRALRRSRKRLHQPAPRPSGGQPAIPHCLLRRWPATGPGKIERLFGTFNTELLPELPGHLAGTKPATPPRLSLAELDHAINTFVANTYHARPHSETGETPLVSWRGSGFLPRSPESLQDLDLLLVMLAKPRCIRRDGIHFQGLRYNDPVLAAYVGETVTIRYDPRDLSEIRVFHGHQFLCRAVSKDHAGEAFTLKDIEAARRAHRRVLRATINERLSRVADFLPTQTELPRPAAVATPPRPAVNRPKLRLYLEDDP